MDNNGTKKLSFVKKFNLKYGERDYIAFLLILRKNNKKEFYVELKKLIGSGKLTAFFAFCIKLFIEKIYWRFRSIFHKQNSGV